MPKKSVPQKFITFQELSAHNNQKTGLWIAVKGVVYDVTQYLDQHPGGPDPFMFNAGKDATEEFLSVGHSDSAVDQAEPVGYLIAEAAPSPTQILFKTWYVTIPLVISTSVAVFSTWKWLQSKK